MFYKQLCYWFIHSLINWLILFLQSFSLAHWLVQVLSLVKPPPNPPQPPFFSFFFFSSFFVQSGGATRWRVCYQRGLPRLVYIIFNIIIIIIFIIFAGTPPNLVIWFGATPQQAVRDGNTAQSHFVVSAAHRIILRVWYISKSFYRW